MNSLTFDGGYIEKLEPVSLSSLSLNEQPEDSLVEKKSGYGYGYEDEQINNSSKKDHMEKASIVHDVILTRIEDHSLSRVEIDKIKSYAENMQEKLWELPGFNQDQAISFAIQIVLHYERPEQTSFKKLYRKEDSVPYTATIIDNLVYVHQKQLLGAGYFKVTYLGLFFNSEGKKMGRVAHQKIKDSSRIKMAEEEAHVQMSLEHPNIVKIYSTAHYPSKSDPSLERFAIYAEHCHTDLQKELQVPNGLTIYEKCSLLHDISSVLAYMHSKGLSHNDIKPDNLMIVSVDGNLVGKLTDFGLAKPFNSIIDNGFHKIFAPEQIKGNRIYNDKTDVFQFGLVLWHTFHPNPPKDHLGDKFHYPSLQLMVEALKSTAEGWESESTEEKAIVSLALMCLDPDPNNRPTMSYVEGIFKNLLTDLG